MFHRFPKISQRLQRFGPVAGLKREAMRSHAKPRPRNGWTTMILPVDCFFMVFLYIFMFESQISEPELWKKWGTSDTSVILHFRSVNLSAICRSPVFTQRSEGLCSIGPANQQEKMPHQRQLGRAVVMSLASWENGRCISRSGFVWG